MHVEVRSTTILGNDGDGLKISQENSDSLGTLDIFGFTNIQSIDLENVVQR